MRRGQQEEKDKDAREFEQGGGMQEVSEEKTEKYEGAAGTALPSRWRGEIVARAGKSWVDTTHTRIRFHTRGMI